MVVGSFVAGGVWGVASRMWRLVLLVGVAGALLGWAAPVALGNVSAGPLTFGSPQSIDAQSPYGLRPFPGAVSCAPGSTMCAAVGILGEPPFYSISFLSVSTNAGAANPAWTETDKLTAAPTGVSCPTTSLCVAGFDTADRYSSGTGGVFISTDPSARRPYWREMDIDPETGIADVSCPSAALCVAVDNHGNALISTDPKAAEPKWSTRNVEANALTHVSCPSTSLCVANDYTNDVVITTDPTAPTPTWSAPANIDGSDHDRQLTGLSCPSTALCVAVDTAGRATVTHDPTDPAPTWSTQTIAGSRALAGISCSGTALCVATSPSDGAVITTTDPDAAAPAWAVTPNIGADPFRVSCPSAKLCLAGDGGGGVTTSNDPGDTPSTWSAPRLVAGGNYLLAVSCVATTLCVATDNASRVLISTDPAATDPTWTRDTGFPLGAAVSIACPTSAFCLAVDESGNVATSTAPAAPKSSWNSGPEIPVDVNNDEVVTGLSCVPAVLCAAVTSEGRVAIANVPPATGKPGSWVISPIASASDRLTGISCPSNSLCVAAAKNGEAVISTDPAASTPTWTAPAPIDADSLAGVSCPSIKLCVAVDDAGRAAVTTNPTDPAPTWTLSATIDSQSPLRGVSCAAQTLCVAFDLYGSVVVTSDPTAATPTWTAPTPVASGLDALSCTGAGLCVGVQRDQAITGTAPALTVSLAGSGAGSVSGTGIDCPATCAAPYPSGTAVTLTATPASAATFGGWSGGGCSGTGPCTTTVTGSDTVTATFIASSGPSPPPISAPTPPTSSPGPPHVAQPANLGRPTIIGKRRVGRTLTCAPGRWSNDPTGFAYRWIRNGTSLVRASSARYRLSKLDEGTNLACAATARNTAGLTSARSAAIVVPVPHSHQCPRATGGLSGRRLGLVRLGMSRTQVRRAYAGHARRSGSFRDVFCVAAAGIEVGYPNAGLLHGLGRHARARLQGTAVWASTSNPFYALDGIRTGASGADAVARLRPTAQARADQTTWYLARHGGVISMVKVRRGAVLELAIAISALTPDRRHRSTLVRAMS